MKTIKRLCYVTDDIHNDFGCIGYKIEVYIRLINSEWNCINLN